jgi:hypothetical protein
MAKIPDWQAMPSRNIMKALKADGKKEDDHGGLERFRERLAHV